MSDIEKNAITKEEHSNVNRKILSSSHINLFFGAGVNGDSFPQMSGFLKTREFLNKNLNNPTLNIENDISHLSETKQKKVFKIFRNELSEFSQKIEYSKQGVKDIILLFETINKLVLETENRTDTMKQVNVYTTNYDCIVETCINNLGFLCNVISSSNISNHDKFFDILGYDYSKRRFIPTYLVAKIHGDLENPVLPSNRKYDESLQAKRFEILFRMKSNLSRVNSVLFVIGYSGGDTHINSLLKDCISSGLTVFWFRYDNTQELPIELSSKVHLFDREDQKEIINMTKICSDLVKTTWEKQSVE